VDVDVVLNWRLNAGEVNKIYQTVGNLDAVSSNVLENNVRDSIKAAVSKYVALDVQRNRDKVAATALESLQAKMKKYNVIVDNLSITNINFSEQFNQAIEDAQVQQQKAQAAEYAVKTATNNAAAAVATAQGQADSQKLVQQTLTPEILEKLWIEKWNGILPQYSTSNLPIPVFNIGH
jgi:regulator of protease activity HflC (stomatin/prohibitin superfamily)